MITVIGNKKGGTGKSTLTFNLAVWLAHKGRSLALFDLDPQKTFTDAIEVREEEAYTPPLPAALHADALESPLQADEVLMDVSMSDQDALDQALRLADRVVVPVAPSQADVWSTQRFIRRIKKLRGDNLPSILGVINRADTHPFVPETRETQEALDLLPHIERVPVVLHNRAAFRRAFSEGLAAFELEPNGKAALELERLARQLYAQEV